MNDTFKSLMQITKSKSKSRKQIGRKKFLHESAHSDEESVTLLRMTTMHNFKF